MTEIFLGNLPQVKLFDILKPLLNGKKTGKVFIKGKEDGEVYLSNGNIVQAKTSHSRGEYAFYIIMNWETGKISFDPGVSSRERTIEIPTERLLLNWSDRKQQWEKIHEVIPSKDVIFRLSLLKNGEDKNISADRWNVLALCNGVRTVSEMIHALNWDEFKTLDTIYQLVQSGLLEKVEPQKLLKKKLISKDFFPMFESELKKVIGPIAPIIIEKKLMEFGETEDSLLLDHVLPLIKAVGEEIPDDQGREEFKKEVMKFFSIGK